jgi:hypothetical protein
MISVRGDADVGVRLLDADTALAERLDLASGQHDARLEPLEEVVVVPRLSVLRNRLLARHASIVGSGSRPDLPPCWE